MDDDSLDVIFALLIIAGIIGFSVFMGYTILYPFYRVPQVEHELVHYYNVQIVQAQIDSPAVIINMGFDDFTAKIVEMKIDTVYYDHLTCKFYVFNEYMTIAYAYQVRAW